MQDSKYDIITYPRRVRDDIKRRENKPKKARKRGKKKRPPPANYNTIQL